MSKTQKTILLTVALLLFGRFTPGQDLDISITLAGQTASVSGRFSPSFPRHDSDRVRFLDDYAGLSRLAERFGNVRTSQGSGTLPLKRVDAARYLSPNGPFFTWLYDVDLRPLAGTVAPAHTSWIGDAVGVLTLDDLLPQEGAASARVTIKVPSGWSVYTTAHTSDGTTFSVPNVEKATFLIARSIRRLDVGGMNILLHGEWQFTDKEAAAAASEVLEHYQRSLGPPGQSQIAILKFPTDIPPGQWEADTRGSTITIVSSDAPFKSQSLNRLHEQLRHEMFHLWFPNGVNLSGNYDWFYEGFALYQSLKLGVAVNRIRFDDYLDTLSRAYSMDSFGSKRVSLIEASKNRFNGNDTAVYARGMLVAFLCDLATMDVSKGKHSTDDLVKEIYQTHPPSSPRIDGNDAILAIMRLRPELAVIADKYVRGAEPIDWATMLDTAGLEFSQIGREKELKVVPKPNGRQKDILNKLGYNNWRKPAAK